MNVETVLFIFVGAVALVAAIAMVVTRNMVHSALFMVVVFLATAVLYLIYQAPLIAMLQITVYAGGIMVLFLFVIMLIGAEKMSHVENLRWQRPLAFGLAAALLIVTVYLASLELRTPAPVEVGPDFGSPEAIGQVLFSQYVLPFEVISILLLVAMVGAVVLTRKEKTR
ncbi:MAG TPA: NADH-quinone oxidoreductase subunit J [Anaerolineae bacterium]|nr:NADH-quinone oxidoreductase subunit J [Anaerolineae bacterium]